MNASRAFHLAVWIFIGAFAMAARAGEIRVIQYFHPAFNHYFMTANPAEIAALDAATAVPAFAAPATWARTGVRLIALDAPGVGTVPVCRFFTDRFGNKASHFFTASAAECDAIKASPDWTYEGIAFHAWTATPTGDCASGLVPVWRYYNNGWTNAPNHAYTADAAQAGRLASFGYTPEGVAFCVPTSATSAAVRTGELVSTTWTFPELPEVYGPGPLRIAFPATVYHGTNWKLSEVGATQIEYYLHHEFNSAWSSQTGWDPLAGGYLLVGGSGFEGAGIAHIAYAFDRVDGASAPVCSHVVYFLGDGFTLHPFQHSVWSGCRIGQMNRS